MAANSQSTSFATYPDQSINPAKKGYDWILSYTRAAYKDSTGYMPWGSLNMGNLKMAEIKLYALGKQSVDKYKKIMKPGEPSNESWRAIDWTAPAFLCKFREIALSKLLQKKFDPQAYAIDPLSRSQEDEYFNQMMVKIMMRDVAFKAESELSESPVVAPQAGEPQDMEQLAMQRQYGYKHQMASEAENAINLIFQQNNIPEEGRKRLLESLYDWGIAGTTTEIDENGMVRAKIINPEYLGLSYCEKPDFSDLVHWWEIEPTYVGDLQPYYTKEQLDDICKKAVNKNGNPSSFVTTTAFFNPAWMRFKVMVMKIKFLSWDDTVYKEEEDSAGNDRFFKSKYENKRFLSVGKTGELEGQEESEFNAPLDQNEQRGQPFPKYINSTKKVVYQSSWVVDTDYMHNWGLRPNQNRKLSSWWDTDLDIQLYAWNFYKMQFGGITERLIPLEDKACMTWFNLQNLSNKLIPYLINIEMNAIEGAGFGKGGKNFKPSELIDFIFSNFVVPWRATDLMGRNPNFKPVTIEATGQLAAFGQLYEELQQTLELMRQVSGLNELTDGSTPNSKTLVPVAKAAIDSTNNAIYLVSDAEKKILCRLADSVVQKVQIAVGLGKVEGYAKALGTNTVQFFSINPDISLHELGVFIEEAPTEAQREALWTDLSVKESQGFLTVADKYYIMTCRNLKEAVAILDYKIQKRKEQAHAEQMQLVQQQTEGNMQVATAAEEMKQDSMVKQGQIDMQLLITEKMMEYHIEEMKKTVDYQGEATQAQGRIDVAAIAAQAKVIAQEIAAKGGVVKQHVANKKPQPKKTA